MVHWRVRTPHLKKVMVAHLSQLHCGRSMLPTGMISGERLPPSQQTETSRCSFSEGRGGTEPPMSVGAQSKQWVQIRKAPPSSWCSSSPTSDLGCLEQSRKPTETVSLIYTLCIALGISYIMLEMACNSIASCRSYYMFHSDHMCAVLGNCHHSA